MNLPLPELRRIIPDIPRFASSSGKAASPWFITELPKVIGGKTKLPPQKEQKSPRKNVIEFYRKAHSEVKTAHFSFTPEEMRSLAEKIQSLEELQENWDGYEAKPISNKTIKDAIDFLQIFPQHLPLPVLSYSADDEILFLWEREDDLFQLSFYGTDEVVYYRRKTREEEILSLLSFPKEIEEHILQLSS